MTRAFGKISRNLNKQKINVAFFSSFLYNKQEITQEELYMRYGFGIDLGGTTVKIAYFDENGTMLHKWEIPTVTENSGSQILPDIAQAVNGYLAKIGMDKENIIGIGIGVPGPVDSKGVVNKCINLGWGVFNIQDALSDLTDLPVRAGIVA